MKPDSVQLRSGSICILNVDPTSKGALSRSRDDIYILVLSTVAERMQFSFGKIVRPYGRQANC